MEKWKKAGHIPELKSLFASPPPLDQVENENEVIPPPPPIPPEVSTSQNEYRLKKEYYGYQLASAGQRLGAVLISGIFEILVIGILAVGLFVLVGNENFLKVIERFEKMNLYSEIFYTALFGGLLHGLFYPSFSGNLGHKLMGLKVINSKTGNLVGFWSSTSGWNREFLKTIFAYAIIPVIWLLFDKKKQNLYDKACKTLVVKNKK